MIILGFILIALPPVLLGYALIVYPAFLWIANRLRNNRQAATIGSEWPSITITVPAYNEEGAIAAALNSLLAVDYPAERRHILVISDASTDNTDSIVRGFESQGVELLRLDRRGGKTAAENAAAAHLLGEFVVNVDASVRLRTNSLKPLIRAFDDPRVGVASGRDVSVTDVTQDDNRGEGGYVDYEMRVRDLETEFGSIVGASGCFYATRRSLYHGSFPEELSRDFASALLAHEKGYRSVSVREAVCLVPRGVSVRREMSRKARTMTRGIATMFHLRHLLDPENGEAFAWMLFSHKVCRWLFYLTLPFAALGLLLLAQHFVIARYLVAAICLFAAIGIIGLRWPDKRPIPRAISICTYVLITNLAGILAWWQFFSGDRVAAWEPTRRAAISEA